MGKKILLAVVLAAVLTTGKAFANPVHPDGWGIGIVGGIGWSNGGVGTAGLSLKAPALPIFWGIWLEGGTHWMHIGATGDYHLLGSMFFEDMLGWFFGIGGSIGFTSWEGGTVLHNERLYTRSWTRFGLGVRAPIGLTFQPIDFLELFITAAPAFGVRFYSNSHDWDDSYSGVGFGFRIGGELGLRFWF